MLLARKYEKEYLFTLGSRNMNASTSQAAQEWRTVYKQLGEALNQLQPLMQTPAEQEQFADWSKSYTLYGDAFTLIQNLYSSKTATPQEANDAMRVFDEPLRTLTDKTVSFADSLDVQAEDTWVGLLSRQSELYWILVSVGIAAVLLSVTVSLLTPRIFVNPIRDLTLRAERIAAGELAGHVPDRARHELGRLARTFNYMVEQLIDQRQSIAARTAELEEAYQQQQQSFEELQQSLEAREALSTVIRELSVPVIPVLPGTIAVPLVGAFDIERAADLQRIVLQAIEEQRASYVLLDVTAVPVLDTQVAQTMLQLTRAIRLLGARPMLVGVRPEVAQTLVHLGIPFDALDIKADLQSAVLHNVGAIKSRQEVNRR
jgi:rsbT co-antagonist protein RsbR